MDVGCRVIDSLAEDRMQVHVSLVLSAPPPPSGLRRRPSTLCTAITRCLRRRRQSDHVRLEPVLLSDLRFDPGRRLGMLAQEVPRVLPALPDALALERVPGARL